MIKTILLTLTMLWGITANAQNFVLLKKINGTARFKIYEGEILRFKHKDSTHMQREKLETVTDSSVITASGETMIEDIKIVHFRDNRFLPIFIRSLGVSLIVAGPMFFAYNAVYTIALNISGTWGRAALVAAKLSGSGLGIQVLLKIFTERRVRLGKHWKLVPYDFNHLIMQNPNH